MAILIDATTFRGAGAATKNIKHQLSGLLSQFPVIIGIHPGSINVRLDQPLNKLNWAYVTNPSIYWWDEGPNRILTETFGFLEIKFEYRLGGGLYRAWLFDCYNSAWHASPCDFEIISERIDGVSFGQLCRVHLPRSALA
jgi:hypothetical protein